MTTVIEHSVQDRVDGIRTAADRFATDEHFNAPVILRKQEALQQRYTVSCAPHRETTVIRETYRNLSPDAARANAAAQGQARRVTAWQSALPRH